MKEFRRSICLGLRYYSAASEAQKDAADNENLFGCFRVPREACEHDLKLRTWPRTCILILLCSCVSHAWRGICTYRSIFSFDSSGPRRVSNLRIEHFALLFIPLPVPYETVSNRDEILVSDNVKFYLQSSVTRRVCLIEFQQKVSPPRVLQLGIFLPSVHIFARKRCVFSASPPSLVVSRKFACTLEIGFKANPILSGFRFVREVCLLNVGSESTFTGREGKPVKALSSRPRPSFLRRLRFLSKGCKVFGTK